MTYGIIAFSLLLGGGIGYAISKYSLNNRTAEQTRAVQLLVGDGETTRNWNTVSITEGQSVADLIDKVAGIENISLVWDKEGKDRSITQFYNATKEYSWQYFINGAQPGQAIGRYIPKHGDVIVLLGTRK